MEQWFITVVLSNANDQNKSYLKLNLTLLIDDNYRNDKVIQNKSESNLTLLIDDNYRNDKVIQNRK